MITRKTRFLLTVVFVFLFLSGELLALGGDASSEKTIPLPKKNYSVVITDGQNVKTAASRISWDGKIYIQGRRGDALTTIPFEKLVRVEIQPGKKATLGSVLTTITLKSGETIKLQIKSNSKCFGETSYGQFEIYLRDIRIIVFK